MACLWKGDTLSMNCLWNGLFWVLAVLEKGKNFVFARVFDLKSGSAFEISKSKIKNLEKSSILFNMRSFLKEKMEKHVEDLWQFETTVFWSCQRKMFSDNLIDLCVLTCWEKNIERARRRREKSFVSLVKRRFISSAGGQEGFVSLVMRRFKSSAGGQELFHIVRRRP